MHSKNAYLDIHRATLQVLEKTGVFVEDQQALEVFDSCGAVVDEKNNIANYLWRAPPIGNISVYDEQPGPRSDDFNIDPEYPA